MAEVLTPGCALVQYSGTQNDGQPWVMTAHAQHPLPLSPIPSLSLEDLLSAITASSFIAALAALMPPSYAVTEALVRDVGVVRAPGLSNPLSVPGTGSGGVLPASTAAVVELQITPTPGQPKGGKMFFPGVLESAAVANTLTSGAITAYDEAADALQGDINSATAGAGFWAMVVRSTRFHGAPRATGVTTPVTSPATRGLLGTQVSRLRGKRTRR